MMFKGFFKRSLRKLSKLFPGDFDSLEISNSHNMDGYDIIEYEKYNLSKDLYYLTDQEKIQDKISKFIQPERIRFIISFEDVLLEPIYGWLIKGGKIFKDFLLYNYSIPFPNKSLLRIIKFFGGEKRIENAISLLEISSNNYCHFYEEILSRLVYLLDEVDIDVETYKVIISKELYSQKFFQDFAKNSALLQKLHFVCLNNQHLFCENLFAIRPHYDSKYYLDKVIQLIPTKPKSGSERKVFLTRKLTNVARKSFLIGYENVVDTAKRYSFEIIDTAELNLMEQKELFEETRYLVAIHGAGVTNILWRGNRKMSVLELFDPQHIDLVFNRWCKNNDYYYDAIVGKASNDNIHFKIELDIFEKKLRKMLLHQ